MPIHVQAPNGDVVEFPDGTSDDVMASAMRKAYGGAQPNAAPTNAGTAGEPTPYERATKGMGYGPASSRPSTVIDADQGGKLVDQQAMSGPYGTALAASSKFINGIPIVGPAIQSGIQDAAYAARALVDGSSYDDVKKQGEALTEAAQAAHPNISTGAEIAGAITPLAAIGATAAGSRALGITGPTFLSRLAASAGSNGLISAADTVARGGDTKDVVNNTTIGLGLGAAIPIVGAGINAALRGAGSVVAPRIAAVMNPAQEAERRVGTAIARDTSANPTGVMSAADEAVAQAANVPIVNADRGGEVTRALARSAANQSPEARAAIEKAASDRFGTQSQRAVDYIKKVTGGNVDDLAYQDNLRQVSQAVNRPAYRAAYDSPEAQGLYTPQLQNLMQSPSFRDAVNAVPKKSADRAAIFGGKEIQNPFSQNSQGAYVLRQRADGTLVSPNLEFWDHVKQNLDGDIGVAKRAGDNTRASDLMGLKRSLVGELDAAVPAYKGARQGAAGFFGAEDALEAGKNFANSPRSIPEATRAYAGFKGPEKDAFATGYASELIDRIKASGDRTNVINSVFKNQASRESLQLALGPDKAKQLEAYVRVEDLVDRLRGSMGNSTTARQLVELGIGAGGGYGVTGDWKGAIGGAALMKGARYVGERADAKVMENVAKLLTQNNPSALNGAIQFAAKNPAYMTALEKIGNAIAAPIHGAAAVPANQ